jgi:hypothetical protein
MNGSHVWNKSWIGMVGRTSRFGGKARVGWSGIFGGNSQEVSYTWSWDGGMGLEISTNEQETQILHQIYVPTHKKLAWSSIIQIIAFNTTLFPITNKNVFVCFGVNLVLFFINLAHVHM